MGVVYIWGFPLFEKFSINEWNEMNWNDFVNWNEHDNEEDWGKIEI